MDPGKRLRIYRDNAWDEPGRFGRTAQPQAVAFLEDLDLCKALSADAANVSAVLYPREHRRFSVEEYFMLEEPADSKSEFCDGQIYAMSGASLEHNRIVRNCLFELHTFLRGKKCEVFPPDLRLFVERQKLVTYPDVMVVCGRPRLLAGRRDTVTDATLLIEVLSPSTQSYDKNDKFRMYRDLPSLAEYILVSQDEVRIEQHRRQGPGEWLMTEQSSIGADLKLSSIELPIALKSVYEGVFS